MSGCPADGNVRGLLRGWSHCFQPLEGSKIRDYVQTEEQGLLD